MLEDAASRFYWTSICNAKRCRSKLTFKINSRFIILGLLLGALCFPFLSIPNVDSQLASTSTTMTMPQPPSQGQCSIVSLGFSAKAGRISGTFGSTVTVNFYILSSADLNAIQNCHPSTQPLFAFEQAVGQTNVYMNVYLPNDGIYYFVFVYTRGAAEVSHLAVELTYPSSITIIGAAGSSSTSIASTLTPTVQQSTLSTSTPSASPSRSTTSELTQAPPASSFTLFGFEMSLTSLLLVIGVAIVGVGGAIGGLMFRSRTPTTHALSSYLEKIDATFNQYAVDREECKSRLEQLKRDAIEMLNKGKLEEGHFLMLDEKISQYLNDLATRKREQTSSADDTKENKPPAH
jgi:hypothetical protein